MTNWRGQPDPKLDGIYLDVQELQLHLFFSGELSIKLPYPVSQNAEKILVTLIITAMLTLSILTFAYTKMSYAVFCVVTELSE